MTTTRIGNPHLLAMQYSEVSWDVTRVMLRRGDGPGRERTALHWQWDQTQSRVRRDHHYRHGDDARSCSSM